MDRVRYWVRLEWESEAWGMKCNADVYELEIVADARHVNLKNEAMDWRQSGLRCRLTRSRIPKLPDS